MENVINVLNILSLFVGIGITAVSFLIPLLKTEKAKKNAETALKIAKTVQPYIVDAENFVNYNGAEKLEYVVTKANQYAIKNNINFDETAVTAEIEKLIELTKKVNKREKDIAAEKAAAIKAEEEKAAAIKAEAEKTVEVATENTTENKE